MIDAPALLKDAKRLVSRLEDDLRQRATPGHGDEQPGLAAHLRAEYSRARDAKRTAATYDSWTDEQLTQAAVAWVLTSVFVRFAEDTGLVDDPLLSGPGSRLALARDHHDAYFRQHPGHSDREYLLHSFAELGRHPGCAELVDTRHNPFWQITPSVDAAREIIDQWRRIDPDSGRLVHDFTDPARSTRFLGDLYQDLSESARKQYALLQTPDFVEELILERTLEPAITTFGLAEVRLIDPACGSGHFLLGAFGRLLRHWSAAEPGTNPRELARRALAALAGVDLNPYAAAIARFRLLVAALDACAIKRLADAPAFEVDIAVGDTLLHGGRPDQFGGFESLLAHEGIRHVYETEDAAALARLLAPGRYHVVVGNPPYITPKDAALNQGYRDRFHRSCHRQYSLGVPFTERFFDLAQRPDGLGGEAGYVGIITANSFMKREFGKKLVENVIPTWDLTHVVDTSGAYIPGHGTPTVILLARNRPPVLPTIRAAMGIRGEPSTPADPAKGQVWTAIVDQLDRPGSTSAYVSVSDVPRDRFAKHPWSIGGGGAAELKERLDRTARQTVGSLVHEIGRTTHTGEDDAYYLPPHALHLHAIIDESVPLVVGEGVRDFALVSEDWCVFPYDKVTGLPVEPSNRLEEYFWRYRTHLRRRLNFGQINEERGLRWFDQSMFFPSRYRTALSIAFAFVATHNHFVLDRGGKVFNRTAPVIKLPVGASVDDHLCLLGLLNSSTACFWLKQTVFDRGNGGYGGGIADQEWERFYEFDGTKMQLFPVPSGLPLDNSRRLDGLSQALASVQPSAVAAGSVPTRSLLNEARAKAELLRAEMIGLEEELDWEVYGLYGLVDADGDDGLVAPLHTVPPLALGERAFEIVLARQVADGDSATAWFARHRSTPITELPSQWPAEYRKVVEQRLDVIATMPEIGLIERPEYKRRWLDDVWEAKEQAALRVWLLDRLEQVPVWAEHELVSTARLADLLRADADVVGVARLYAGPDADLAEVVAKLVADEAVPFLAAYRYSETGLRKRAQWEHTWDLQRQEDRAAEGKAPKPGPIAVPPKYQQVDFQRGSFWKLRGKLDVAKERFVSFPGASRDADPSVVIGWAGWDHLERARALAAWYVERKDVDGWDVERLVGLLAGLWELVPWLVQWHDEPDPAYGMGMGVFFEQFVTEEARTLGFTVDRLSAWQPAAKVKGRKGRPPGKAATSAAPESLAVGDEGEVDG